MDYRGIYGLKGCNIWIKGEIYGLKGKYMD